MKQTTRLLLPFLAVAFPAVSQTPADVVETEADRRPKTVISGDCFIQGGTLLTVTNGVIKNGSVLVRGGKIAAIGANLTAPAGVPIIQAVGKYVMPGIVDAHSHVSEEATNEFTDSVTPEVRIRDVLNPNARGIYDKLASGFTTALVLHGSGNAIGGESVVIKLKYRRPVEELPMAGAPLMVKFALGENVKASEGDPFSSGPVRFPKTRMGVEAVYRRAFHEARRYIAAWDKYEKEGRNDPKVAPPRRDMRLEAFSDILRRRMWVHCHSYRADEMLMMLRLSKEFGFKLAALQHALEAYKIAPEIAAAGVGVSTFADDWGYKVEAYDAVPHNAALCLRAGVVTSVNTDTDSGLSTLNVDAAKCMKYGGLTETEALKLITINPAIQLGIDRRVGSLEIGKDADIGIWQGHPLSVYSHCEMTLVEGRLFFERRDAFGLNSHMASSGLASGCIVDHGKLPLPKESRAYALLGGTVHTLSGSDIEHGTVLIRDGKIVEVGKQVAIPRDAERVDVRGLHVYPGLIDAGSLLGLKEIEQVGATIDTSEAGLFHPDLAALTAVNPASEHLAVARTEGVTTALTRPDSDGFFGGGLITGQGAVVDLNGWTPEQMKLRSPASLHVRWPEGTAAMPDWLKSLLPPEELKRRQDVAKEQIRQLTEYFERAKRYAATKRDAADRAAYDPRMEAMGPYVSGQAPVVIHVNTLTGIKKAVELSEKLGLKLILAGAEQSWRMADVLAKKNIPVICSLPVIETTSSTAPVADYDPYDAAFALPALLQRAGVKFCFQSSNAALAKNLKFCAATAAAYGLPREAALRAMTSEAASILGLSQDVGTLDRGKRANVIVTDGDLLDATASLHYLFIGGRPVSLETRHTRLYERYRHRK
jgi:imidazolonepropionase-like amidohydrolase